MGLRVFTLGWCSCVLLHIKKERFVFPRPLHPSQLLSLRTLVKVGWHVGSKLRVAPLHELLFQRWCLCYRGALWVSQCACVMEAALWCKVGGGDVWVTKTTSIFSVSNKLVAKGQACMSEGAKRVTRMFVKSLGRICLLANCVWECCWNIWGNKWVARLHFSWPV